MAQQKEVPGWPKGGGESWPKYYARISRQGYYPQNPASLEQQRKDTLYKQETERLAKEAGMPQLEGYKGLETLENGGKINARTVSGADVQREMMQSPWYQMAMQKQDAEQSRMLGQTQAQQASQLGQARSQLAMRGGLRGGAAERLAQTGAEGGLLASQGVRQSGAIERGNLGMQGADLASRLSQFNAGQMGDVDKTNFLAQVANLGAQENRKLTQFGEKMKSYAAEKTGNAISSSGKK